MLPLQVTQISILIPPRLKPPPTVALVAMPLLAIPKDNVLVVVAAGLLPKENPEVLDGVEVPKSGRGLFGVLTAALSPDPLENCSVGVGMVPKIEVIRYITFKLEMFIPEVVEAVGMVKPVADFVVAPKEKDISDFTYAEHSLDN